MDVARTFSSLATIIAIAAIDALLSPCTSFVAYPWHSAAVCLGLRRNVARWLTCLTQTPNVSAYQRPAQCVHDRNLFASNLVAVMNHLHLLCTGKALHRYCPNDAAFLAPLRAGKAELGPLLPSRGFL